MYCVLAHFFVPFVPFLGGLGGSLGCNILINLGLLFCFFRWLVIIVKLIIPNVVEGFQFPF